MRYGMVTLERRMKENIKNYQMSSLYQLEKLKEFISNLSLVTGMEFLVTERHGEELIVCGNFSGFCPDVVTEPGIKLRVQNRTIGHLYVCRDNVAPESKEQAEKLLSSSIAVLASWGEDAYQRSEAMAYADELEAENGMAGKENHGASEDILTGVIGRVYFEKMLQELDRTEIVPIAVINANINDWKFVNDHFGDEESDRLIRIVAEIVKRNAQPDYLVGRTDGDVFHIIIPMAEEAEVEEFCRRIQTECEQWEDPLLAPSVAMGCAYKMNLEEHIADKLSDAEYEMFNHKFQMKNKPDYRARLEKGIK